MPGQLLLFFSLGLLVFSLFVGFLKGIILAASSERAKLRSKQQHLNTSAGSQCQGDGRAGTFPAPKVLRLQVWPDAKPAGAPTPGFVQDTAHLHHSMKQALKSPLLDTQH